MKVVFKLLSTILCVLLGLAAAWLVYELYALDVLPAQILWVAIAILILIALVFILLQLKFTHSLPSKIIITILTAAVTFVYAVSGFYITKTNGFIGQVTGINSEMTSYIQVYVKSDSALTSEQSLNGQTVGMVNSLSTAAVNECVTDLESKGIQFTVQNFESIQDLLAAFYNNEVNAVILNASMVDTIGDIDDGAYKDFAKETKVIYTYTYRRQASATTKQVNDVTADPFNVLITGMDSRHGFDEVSRSDVNMIATINPQTHTILLTSIPRDYYVETVCDPSLGCQNGALDKLTHTGLHGTETTKATIEKLLGIDINYIMQVNFSSVINLVDALGGIDIEVAPGYAVPAFWTNENYGVEVGNNHLNGEAALAYARERFAYEEGDRQRVKNQQQVLMAVAQKASSPAVIGNYAGLMDALSGAFNTDMNSDEIQNFIKFQIAQNPQWTFINYSLDGEGATEMSAELGSTAYVMIPDQETIRVAKERIAAVLAGDSPQQVESIN